MEKQSFDVFLSYRSADRTVVESIANWLKEQRLKVWFDKWRLRPGLPWQEALEQGITCSDSIAVFVGDKGLGPWEVPEMRAALNEQVKRGCPVIPVFLPGSDGPEQLPLFLKAQQWVDLRAGWPDPLSATNLLWGITGRDPAAMEEPQVLIPAQTPKVFLANRVIGNFERVLNQALAPTLQELGLSFRTLTDCESELRDGDLAKAVEEAAMEALTIIWNFDSEAPWIPVFLQTPPEPEKNVIVLACRGLTVPEMLHYALVIRYKSTPAGIVSLKQEIADVLSASLSPTKLAEAKMLCHSRHFEAALITASNYLYDYLRKAAVTRLGYSYFHEKPLRYHSLAELFKVLLRKHKLRLKTEASVIDWQKLVRLRNEAAHGSPRNPIDHETCQWYLDSVELIERLNPLR